MPFRFLGLRRNVRNDSGDSAPLQRAILALAAACATTSLAGCMVMAVGSAAVSTVATVGSAAVSVATTAVSTTYDVTAAGVKAVAGSDEPAPPPPPQPAQPAQ
ncbi:putative membrane-spanning protein [Cupriavidus necator H850]|jgi:hypothetical protein|uniref:hypothetical protein n=1 Tax=Cupriavidus TaxID=106589 RepID=UPI00142E9E65|nr:MULTISPECIES: hypothetical protein [Cupriavidus]KAI3606525.1 putative membrane-spanning protein [Cupriavidus necator H850]MDX6013660.1 hypothetical protein [Cupriavidus necator]QUN27295.1 hypothetical protein KB879_24935 [Cupriavidus sp. KK10]